MGLKRLNKKIVRKTFWPGETCTEDTECHSKSCTNGICTGKTKDETCSTNLDCDVGLYCKNPGLLSANKCLEWLGEGETCSADEECRPSMFCNSNKCQKWLSVADGVKTSKADARVCLNAELNSGFCSAPLKRKNKLAVGNSAGAGVCEYTNASGSPSPTTKDSVCGMAQAPSAFCPLGHADEEYVTVLNLVSKPVDSSRPKI